MRHDQRTDENERMHSDNVAAAAGRNQPEGRHAERDVTEVPSMRRTDEDKRADGSGRSVDKSTPEREREEGRANQPMARSPQQMEAHPEPTPTESEARDAGGRDRSDRNTDRDRSDHTTATGQRDTINRDTANRDATNRDTANRDTANRDTTNRDATNRDAANRDTFNRDATNRNATNRQAEPARADGAAPRPNGAEKPVELFRSADVERFRTQWQEIQTRFVDDPRDAVQSADHLVTEVIKSLATTVNGHKTELEGQWGKGGQTEDLRLTLRRYRSFLNRLLEV